MGRQRGMAVWLAQAMPQKPRTTGRCNWPRTWSGAAGRLLAALAVLAAAAAAASCSQPPLATPPAPVVLRLAGSTSMQPLLHELTEAYSRRYAYVRFDLASVGSAAGLEALRRGNADLALVARPLEPEEESEPQTGKRLLIGTAIARDAIAIIVNEHNPVRSLDRYQLRKVFAGQIGQWADLGVPGREIHVVSREDGSATRLLFEERVMQGHPVTPAALVMPGSQAVRDYVASHEEAIGYVSIAYLRPGVAALAIDGVAPTRETIEDGSYPLTRPFLLVSLPNPSREVMAFVQFTRSAAGQAIIRRTYGLKNLSR